MPSDLKPEAPKGAARSNRAPSAISYDFILRRQAQVELEQYEQLLRTAATTSEPITSEQWERITGFYDGF